MGAIASPVIWVFILLFTLPTFGGPVRVQFEFASQDGCQRIQKVVLRELAQNAMQKFDLIECHAVTP